MPKHGSPRSCAAAQSLPNAARALVDEANAAGGKDNITVVLFRLAEIELGAEPDDQPTIIGAPAVVVPAAAALDTAEGAGGREVIARRPRAPGAAGKKRRRHPKLRRAGVFIGILALVLVPIAIGAKIVVQSIYFVGTNDQGYVTVYQGVPYNLPGGAHLYTTDFVSGVNAQSLPRERRRTLLDHTLRSRKDALSLVRQLELGRLTN